MIAFDQRRIVGGKKAEGIADLVVEAAFGQIELDMPGLLLRARLVEPRARDEGRARRIVARAAGLVGGFGGGRVRRLYHCVGAGAADLGLERLQHAGGFLAAGHAEVEPLFRLAEDRVGIVSQL